MKHKERLTRRELLRSAGAAALAAAFPGTFAEAESQSHVEGALKQRASPFELADVRLLEGPFRQAQRRDAQYLLRLEPDRLLHNFRANAGLRPKAPVYGGWESQEPWVEIRCHGHTLGHYLSACSLMLASTGDEQFKRRSDYIVAELRECQGASGSGLVCAFPDGEKSLRAVVDAKRFVGVPWYTMHKIFAGLRDAHLHTGSRAALEVLSKLSDWAVAFTRDISDEQFQHMLGTEHGGMNEVLLG